MKRMFQGLVGLGLSVCWVGLPAALAAPTTQPATVSAESSQADSDPSQIAQPLQFMRFVDQGKTGGQLETSDITFENAQGIKVHLVAVVHIGEQAYYEQLNESFHAYDAVLYEMVMPRGSSPPRAGESSDSGVSQFQRFLKDSLGLDYQLDVIDYYAPNFVHADMDTQTFESMQRQRGESFASLMLRQIMDALADPSAYGNADSTGDLTTLMRLLTQSDPQTRLKLIIARQMGDMERIAAGLDGPDGSVILAERNNTAYNIFKHELELGKSNMAIFFGAAHMPGLAKKLESDGFIPVAVRWRVAWNLTVDPSRPSILQRLSQE